jgi:endonuclease/exonuclease/phosphatase family metal-dependent hydrolase
VDLQLDHDVRFARTPTRSVSLPAHEQLDDWSPSPIDRIGSQLGDRTWLVAGASLLGGAALGARSLRTGSSIAATIGSGVLGAALGAATIVAEGATLDALRGVPPRSESTTPPTAPSSPVVDEDLRVMPFNIHGTLGPDGELLGSAADLERVARAIERERPDVVLLQELDDHAAQNGFRDVLGELAQRLDADGAVATAATRTVTGRRNGTAVLTFNGIQVADARGIRSPDHAGEGTLRRISGAIDTAANAAATLVGREWHPTGSPPYRPRTVTDVLVTTPAGNAVRVLSGHWSWPEGGVDHPRRQVDPLAGLLGAWEGPTILGGDFNVRSGTPGGDAEARVLAREGRLVDAFTARGIPTDAPERGSFGVGPGGPRIDRIYGSSHLDVRDVHVSSFPAGEPVASDHRPVIVDYRLRAGD